MREDAIDGGERLHCDNCTRRGKVHKVNASLCNSFANPFHSQLCATLRCAGRNSQDITKNRHDAGGGKALLERMALNIGATAADDKEATS